VVVPVVEEELQSARRARVEGRVWPEFELRGQRRAEVVEFGFEGGRRLVEGQE
jgi:hypothetical protein